MNKAFWRKHVGTDYSRDTVRRAVSNAPPMLSRPTAMLMGVCILSIELISRQFEHSICAVMTCTVPMDRKRLTRSSALGGAPFALTIYLERQL